MIEMEKSEMQNAEVRRQFSVLSAQCSVLSSQFSVLRKAKPDKGEVINIPDKIKF